MDTDDKDATTEYSDAGFPIEIYSDERIREFLAEDELTLEQKKRLEEKLKESKTPKSPPRSDRS